MAKPIELYPLGSNVLRVDLPSGAVIFSYREPVALILRDGRRVRTDRFFSRTTARHLGEHCSGFQTIDHAEFESLLGELA